MITRSVATNQQLDELIKQRAKLASGTLTHRACIKQPSKQSPLLRVLIGDFLPLSPSLGVSLCVGSEGGAEFADDQSHWKGNVDHTEEENDRADTLAERGFRVEVSVSYCCHGYCSPPACVQDTEIGEIFVNCKARKRIKMG